MSKKLIIGVVIVSTFVALGSAIFWWQVFQDNSVSGLSKKKTMSEGQIIDLTPTQWVGLIGTLQGFLSVYTENNNTIQSSHFLPPGVPLDFFQGLTDYYDNTRQNFMQLLEDGRLIFQGNPSITSAPEESVLYVWPIKSSNNPMPFFRIQEDRNIQLFAFSKDLSRVAIISVTRTEEEIYEEELPEDVSPEAVQQVFKVIEERTKQWEEEIRTISIYDTGSHELISTITLDERNQIQTTRLIWGNDTFVVVSNQLTVYNPENGQKILSLDLDPPAESSRVAPDGLKYYDGQTGVRHIHTNQLLSRISAPELTPAQSVNPSGNLDQQFVFLGPAAFSPDSKKMLLQAGSVNSKNFMVWEMDIEKSSTKEIGELSTIIPIQNQPAAGEDVHIFNFLAYHPTGEKALFAFHKSLPNRVGTADVFLLDLGNQEAQHIAGPFSAGNLREISFIGWYKERE